MENKIEKNVEDKRETIRLSQWVATRALGDTKASKNDGSDDSGKAMKGDQLCMQFCIARHCCTGTSFTFACCCKWLGGSRGER